MMMIMTTENFVIYNLIMLTFTWYLYTKHGEASYDNGFMDAVQLHSEGRLTYNVSSTEEEKVITIEVSDEE